MLNIRLSVATPSSDSPFYGKKILLKVLSIVEG